MLYSSGNDCNPWMGKLLDCFWQLASLVHDLGYSCGDSFGDSGKSIILNLLCEESGWVLILLKPGTWR